MVDSTSTSLSTAADAGAFVTAGESKGITALLEVRESDFSMTDGAAVVAATAGAFATAGESEDITALLEVRESDFSKTDGAAVALLRLQVRVIGILDCVR